MAITIDNEDTVEATLGANTVIIAGPTAGRKGTTFQVLSDGIGWVKLTGAASIGDGIRIRGWEVFNIDNQFVGEVSSNFYEGPVNLFWEGPKGDNPPATVDVQILEAS